MSIATTGRIIKIDAKNRTMKVRGSEGPAARSAAPPEMKESLWQRIGVKMPNMRMPGGITISLPGRTTKVPTAKPAPDINNLNEYTVVTNNETVFQDGIDSLRFEDFKSGETISIHGLFSGSTLTVGTGTSPGHALVQGSTGVDGFIQYNAGTFNTTGNLVVAGTVRLSDAARNAGGTPTNKKTLEAGTIEFDTYANLNTATATVTGGLVDLNDNDALFHANTLSGNGTFDVGMMIRSARNGGSWNGNGLTSTAAKNNAQKVTGLGAITGAQYRGSHSGTTSFNGRALVNTDTVVKYTYNGDADLSGKVDGSDYSQIDSNFNNQVTLGVNIGGWFNGDFDYNGKIDGSDYSLIDAAFNAQGAVVLGRGNPNGGELAGPDAVHQSVSDSVMPIKQYFAKLDPNREDKLLNAKMLVDGGDLGGVTPPAGQAVPEPATLGLIGVSMLGALARRRRTR
jgi:hypothetical protein